MIEETVQTLELHFDRANAAYDEAGAFIVELSAEMLDDFEKVKVIDSFILRFIKIQDLMGHKLFRELLNGIGEYESSMSMLDMLDRLEKLGFIAESEEWMDYRNLRNVLTHEYPDNRNELIEGVQLAFRVYVDIRETYRNMASYIAKRGLQ